MKPFMRTCAALAAAAVVATGCSSSGAEGPTQPQLRESAIILTLLDSVVGPGHLVRLEQRSLLTRAVGYNHCVRSIQRKVGTDWVNLPEDLRICTMVLYELRPGEVEVVGVDVPPDATPGVYRAILHFQPMAGPGSGVSVATPPFEVR